MLTVPQLNARIEQLEALDELLAKAETKTSYCPSMKSVTNAAIVIFAAGTVTAFCLAANFYSKIDDPDSSTVNEDPNEKKRLLAAQLMWFGVAATCAATFLRCCMRSTPVRHSASKLNDLPRADHAQLKAIMTILQQDNLLQETKFANPNDANILTHSVGAFRSTLRNIIKNYEAAREQLEKSSEASNQYNNTEILPVLTATAAKFDLEGGSANDPLLRNSVNLEGRNQRSGGPQLGPVEIGQCLDFGGCSL